MRILVIKLAALGDVVLAFSAMQRIRMAHPDAEITLLTTPPYAGLAEATGLFDHVQTDGRPRKLRDLVGMLARRGYSQTMAVAVVTDALAAERERRRV